MSMKDHDEGLIEAVQDTIRRAISGSKAFVLDPRNDGVHLEAVVISEQFIGKPLLEQHRMVMKPLEPLFQGQLHALGVKTFTPERWRSNRHRIPSLQHID